MTEVPHPRMLHEQHQDPAVGVEVGKKGKLMPGVPRIRSEIFFPPEVGSVQHL